MSSSLDELFQEIAEDASLRTLARRLIRKHSDRPSMNATWLASMMMQARPAAPEPRCHAVAGEVLHKMFGAVRPRPRRRVSRAAEERVERAP